MRSDNHGAHYSKASISRMMGYMRKDVGEWGASQAQLRGGLAGTLVAYHEGNQPKLLALFLGSRHTNWNTTKRSSPVKEVKCPIKSDS